MLKVSLSYLHLQGPKDTPFEGGVFEVILKVPEQYPLVAPNVRFKTKIFHPNVHFKVINLCISVSYAAISGTNQQCLSADGRNLSGYLEDSMESSMDIAVCMPGHHCSHVRLST